MQIQPFGSLKHQGIYKEEINSRPLVINFRKYILNGVSISRSFPNGQTG